MVAVHTICYRRVRFDGASYNRRLAINHTVRFVFCRSKRSWIRCRDWILIRCEFAVEFLVPAKQEEVSHIPDYCAHLLVNHDPEFTHCPRNAAPTDRRDRTGHQHHDATWLLPTPALYVPNPSEDFSHWNQ